MVDATRRGDAAGQRDDDGSNQGLDDASHPGVVGPLRVLDGNPRYFTDGTGRAIYLTGSHVWNNLQDRSSIPGFDFDAYLGFLEAHQHNFVRLWHWGLARSNCGDGAYDTSPHPWQRTGPGKALDGKPKFDFDRYDEAFFERLRSRVTAARDHGIYVGVMLFEGFGHRFCQASLGGNPFDAANNINGIDAPGTEILTLDDPAVTVIQEAYVRKVIDTVGDLDNVLWEISNEAGAGSVAWQYHFIQSIRNYESSRPKRHPVGMTFPYPDGNNAALFASDADWISPNNEGDYLGNPPAATGEKVILADTDHLCGKCFHEGWPWRSFLRGANPILMDGGVVTLPASADERESIRREMGQTRTLADRIDLARMLPHGELASTGYCLADPGREYVAYGSGDLELTLSTGAYSVEWFSPDTEEVITTEDVTADGGPLQFDSPFDGQTVLHLRLK